jgi:hypothetical protein
LFLTLVEELNNKMNFNKIEEETKNDSDFSHEYLATDIHEEMKTHIKNTKSVKIEKKENLNKTFHHQRTISKVNDIKTDREKSHTPNLKKHEPENSKSTNEKKHEENKLTAEKKNDKQDSSKQPLDKKPQKSHVRTVSSVLEKPHPPETKVHTRMLSVRIEERKKEEEEDGIEIEKKKPTQNKRLSDDHKVVNKDKKPIKKSATISNNAKVIVLKGGKPHKQEDTSKII